MIPLIDHPSLFYILLLAKENRWIKFLDVALEYGYDGSKTSVAILKSLCLTVISDGHCPIHDYAYTLFNEILRCTNTCWNATQILTQVLPQTTSPTAFFHVHHEPYHIRSVSCKGFTILTNSRQCFNFILEYLTLPCTGYKIYFDV